MSQPSGKMICSDRTPGERGSFARCLAALLLVVVGLAVQSRAAGQSVPDDGSVGPRILFSSPFAPEPAPFLHSRVSVSDPLPGTVV
ncbi:MAG: hypothetical protein ACK5A3_22640, partial [Planctomyces sp.]